MDTSIEIIKEINVNKSLHASTSIPDVEVISVLDKGSSSSQVSVNQRPSRKRKPTKVFEENQKEPTPKRKRSIGGGKQKVTKLRRLLRLSVSKKRSLTPKVKRPNLKVKAGESAKANLLKRISVNRTLIKPSRSEAGGAGTLKTRKVATDDIEIIFEWDPSKVIAERQGVEEWQAKNIIDMFDKENTLPFIARYRREKTGNIDVEKLREIQNTYSQLKLVQDKVVKTLKSDCAVKIPHERKLSLMRATTTHEVEHLTAAYKSSGKRSYAERARELGLDSPANEILLCQSNRFLHRQDLGYLMNDSKEGLRSEEEVQQGLQHIIADIISKDAKVLTFIKNLIQIHKPTLECARKKVATKEKSSGKISTGPSPELCAKYQNYSEFRNIAWNVRPHQVLAINRGENQNVLTVKVVISTSASREFFNFCYEKWLLMSSPSDYRQQLIIKSIEDSWERLVKPFLQRQVRSRLTEMAEIASVEVFTANLKKLLLTPPVRGKSILAIDPGFLNGCKIGVTNLQGDMLLTTTIYPFRKNNANPSEHWTSDHNARTLSEIVHKYRCEYFAIGNGTACREMEKYLSHLINSGCFSPFNVQYTIVNESGASQYSVSPEAKSEFPTMDPNHISAVSLARRVQDPLLEYVKVHPMHLGVGMYQHDIPERILHSSLDSVMTECVSFVGLDINVASEFVLRKLSGLNKSRAANIVEHRRINGPFVNREQIKDVKGIGPRTFEQCAGFIKIMPVTLEAELIKSPRAKSVPISACSLDRTVIHPESYDVAFKFMNLVGVRSPFIGSDAFCKRVREFSVSSSLDDLANRLGSSSHTIQLIIEGLTQSLDFDIRAQFDRPLFRKGITSIDDLIIGSKLTGSVLNVTHFGAFVDIGVGTNGLIHLSSMNGMRIELGSIVEVMVKNIEKNRGRIGLHLCRVL